MTKTVASKEYWNSYWGDGEFKYPKYDLTKGLFYSYHLLLSKYIEALQGKSKKKIRIIDCGCGEGLILKYLYENFSNLDIWGIEHSDAYFKAKEMTENYNYNISLIKGDLFSDLLPEFEQYFDIVISVGLIEHFNKPTKVLSTLSKILSKGGCFITIIPNFNGIYNFLWKLYDHENYNYHIPIKKENLIQMHQGLNLKDVSFYTLGTNLIPGIHNANTISKKILYSMIVNINGRILQKFKKRQSHLEEVCSFSPCLACVGYKEDL